MKTSLIKVQNPKIVGGYKYYLLITVNEQEPQKRMVVKITEKQATEFINMLKNLHE